MPQPISSMTILDIDNLTLWYESLFGDIKALDRCSISVERGSVTALIGINGAGKTTLLMTISGVVGDYDGKLTDGRIVFEGRDITGLAPLGVVSLGIAHAPQDRHVFYTIGVEENLLLGAYHRRRHPDAAGAIEKDKEAVFELFPVLRERKKQKAGTLSGGEQQMLSIGRALMSSPRLLILDEPFLGLAPMVIDEILKAMGRLKERGLTLLVAEQNVTEILSVADIGYVMDEGFIVTKGTAMELWNSEKIRAVYLGERE